MGGLPSMLSLFYKAFNKFNKQIIFITWHSNYLKYHFDVKMSRFFHLLHNVIIDVITLRY